MAKTGSISITQGSQSGNSTYIEVRGIITTSGESYRGSHRTGTYSIAQDGVQISSGSFQSAAPANSTTELFVVGLWVNHKSDGSSGTISASYNYDSGWCTGNGSTTLSSIVFWTNINVLNPDDVEITTSGAFFDVNWSDGTAWRNLTNEPEPAVYKSYGSYMELYNIRPFAGYKLESVNGATPHVNNPNVYCKSITDSSEINIHLAYRTYNINYNANGGLGSIASHTVKWKEGFTLASNTFTRNGYTFCGFHAQRSDGKWATTINNLWATDIDIKANGYEYQTYQSGEVHAIEESWCDGLSDGVMFTFCAIWKPNIYTITFDDNGGISSIDSLEIAYETRQNNNVSQYIPVRQAYQFLGWYTSPTGGIQVYDANGLCTNDGTYWLNDVCVYTEDYTLYAQWKALNLAYYKLNGEWLRCYSYIKVNGVWYAAIYKRNFNGDYDFEIAVLLDEEGNTLTDENGNVLVIIE